MACDTVLQVPNVDDQLNDVTNAISDINFDSLVEQGRETFNVIRSAINDTVSANVDGQWSLVCVRVWCVCVCACGVVCVCARVHVSHYISQRSAMLIECVFVCAHVFMMLEAVVGTIIVICCLGSAKTVLPLHLGTFCLFSRNSESSSGLQRHTIWLH